MNLFALFSPYVTINHIILYLLFYNYLKFTNLKFLINSSHINTIKILQIFYIELELELELLELQLQFYNFTYNNNFRILHIYNYNYNFRNLHIHHYNYNFRILNTITNTNITNLQYHDHLVFIN